MCECHEEHQHTISRQRKHKRGSRQEEKAQDNKDPKTANEHRKQAIDPGTAVAGEDGKGRTGRARRLVGSSTKRAERATRQRVQHKRRNDKRTTDAAVLKEYEPRREKVSGKHRNRMQ